MESLESEVRAALSRHSAENGSNTPDFILAQYLMACLAAYDVAVMKRSSWYGRHDAPGGAASCAVVGCLQEAAHNHAIGGPVSVRP